MIKVIESVLESNYGDKRAAEELCAVYHAFLIDALFSLERNILDECIHLSDEFGNQKQFAEDEAIKSHFADYGINLGCK